MENKPRVNGAAAPLEAFAPPAPASPPDPPASRVARCKELPADLIEKLKAPLPQEAVSPNPERPHLSVIKVIYVVERLNEVFGLNGWRISNHVVEQGKMIVVKGTLMVSEYGIEIEQYGGNDNPDRGDAYKGACTDALSKCASYLGVGMDVYKGLRTGPQKNFQPKSLIPRFAAVRSVIGVEEYETILKRHGYSDVAAIPTAEEGDKTYGVLLEAFRKRYSEARRDLGETQYEKVLGELRLNANARLSTELAIRVFRRVQVLLRARRCS